jgi:hypothetical protein
MKRRKQIMNDSKTIRNIEDIHRQQLWLKTRIRQQEKELRGRVQQLPGELFAAGANALIPAFLSGKITSSMLQAGKKLINNTLSSGDAETGDSKLLTAVKQVGFFSVLRLAYRVFIGNK